MADIHAKIGVEQGNHSLDLPVEKLGRAHVQFPP